MDAARIYDLLRLGPNQRIIFARDVPPPGHVARMIVSLANTEGGVILFGVNDHQTIVGLKRVQAALKTITHAAQSVTPPVLIEPQLVAIDGKEIITLEVPQGYNTPYMGPDGGVLVRQTTRIVPANAEQAAELAQRAFAGAALIPLTERDPARRLQPKQAAPTVDLEHILLKLERLIIANAELTRKLDEANSWQSRITDQVIGAVLGLVISLMMFYLFNVG